MLSITENFKFQQLRYERVRTAYDDKSEAVFALLKSKNLQLDKLRLFIRVFKKEELLEIWAKNADSPVFQLLKSYKIAASSGNLGPKRKMGDMQTPEGFYYIERFNPVSNFYLSLGINYPNESDKILGEKGNLGGDIFIHGSNVTVGCMPMTDEVIKEIYILNIEAKNAGQTQIPIHIFPTKLIDSNFILLQKWAKSPDFISYWKAIEIGKDIDYEKFMGFWKTLKEGFDYFEEQKKLPIISVKSSGIYSIK